MGRIIVGGERWRLDKRIKILVISICNEKLHELEFVRPIEDILKNERFRYKVRPYKTIEEKDIDHYDKIIICGTSLKDNEFCEADNLEKFDWIKETEKPILGICGGMHVIGLVFGGKLMKKTEIGYCKEKFKKEFLGSLNYEEVYHLHNYHADFGILDDFDIYCIGDGVVKAVKNKDKEIYGVLFHPEVRQKGLIIHFCNS